MTEFEKKEFIVLRFSENQDKWLNRN